MNMSFQPKSDGQEMNNLFKTYKDKNERMEAFEDLMITLYQMKDPNDKHILLPGLGEISNIYWQAEMEIR